MKKLDAPLRAYLKELRQKIDELCDGLVFFSKADQIDEIVTSLHKDLVDSGEYANRIYYDDFSTDTAEIKTQYTLTVLEKTRQFKHVFSQKLRSMSQWIAEFREMLEKNYPKLTDQEFADILFNSKV